MDLVLSNGLTFNDKFSNSNDLYQMRKSCVHVELSHTRDDA